MNVVGDLKAVQDKFKINIDELVKTNALTSLLVNWYPNVIFILETAVAAYYNEGGNRYLPSIPDYHHFLNIGNTAAVCCSRFFDAIQNVDAVVDKLRSQALRRHSRDSDLNKVFSELSTLPSAIFQRLLYFTLFTVDVYLSEISQVWYTSIRESYRIRAFEVSCCSEKEEQFGAVHGSSTLLFHGTNDSCLYSICRNGIKALSNTHFQKSGCSYGEGIYLSSNFWTAVGYSGSATKVVLCYEAKHAHASCGDIYVMQEDKICLRAILWCKISPSTVPLFVESLMHHLRRPDRRGRHTILK